ncbi:hypothetical protein FHX14_005352 [Rhizobium sp. BK619]|nr:hypothetical protein [Rhizobium sp. BK619]
MNADAPAGRMAKASEIASVALGLAGCEASLVHWLVYTADGGGSSDEHAGHVVSEFMPSPVARYRVRLMSVFDNR